jgi:cell division protein ZipA
MLRTILLILGVLIILAIAYDGWRRKQKRLRRMQTRGVLDVQHDDETLFERHEQAAAQNIPEADFPTVEIIDAPPEALFVKNKVIALEPEALKPKPKGSQPVEIETVAINESANEVIDKPIEPSKVRSANEVIPESVARKSKKVVAPVKPPNVISLTVMSVNSRPFAGYDVIHALEENYLHFGEFDIYHRHKYRNGKGPLYFSVACVTKPGTINPKKIGELSTPGLIIFMELDNPKHDRVVFKLVLATAHQLAKKLDGVVCDDRRVPLREGTLRVYAEKLKL